MATRPAQSSPQELHLRSVGVRDRPRGQLATVARRSDAVQRPAVEERPRGVALRKERLQGLADDVPAVALTLLALQLPLPHRSRDLAREPTRQSPLYAGYVVSFVTVAIVWINDHALMERISKIDRSVLEFNLLVLLSVAMIPWPTGLLALHLRNRGQSAGAAVVYGT
jgi:uncharacterized membrane protein